MLAEIDPAAMQRIAVALGLCNMCGLDAAMRTGESGRPCDACYRCEVRLELEAGEMVSGLTSTG